MRIARALGSTLVLVTLATSASARTDPYIVAPAPPLGYASVTLADVSGDGSRAVGTAIAFPSFAKPVFCDEFGVTTTVFPEIPAAYAKAISSDGSTILGEFQLTFGGAFVWTVAEGAVPLPDVDEASYGLFASDLSADGSIVVGGVHPPLQALAARWDDGVRSLFTPLGYSGGMPGSLLVDVSETGLVLGYDFVSDFVSDGTTIERLLQVEELNECSAEAMSEDGTTWVGLCRSNAGPSVPAEGGPFVPVRWRGGDEQSLHSLTEAHTGTATDVSADGSVVVGIIEEGPARRPFVWTGFDGFRFLEERLEGAGVDTSAVPIDATYEVRVSADGHTVVGSTFIARIPEPQPVPETSATLGSVAALVALARFSAWRSSR